MGVEAVSTQEARPGPSFGDPGNECNYPRYIMLHERKPQKTSAVECILASGLGASKGQSKKNTYTTVKAQSSPQLEVDVYTFSARLAVLS